MTGDPTSPARTCLKGEEIDPQGIATPCVTPTVSATPTPTITSLPTVGGDGSFLMAALFSAILVLIVIRFGKK